MSVEHTPTAEHTSRVEHTSTARFTLIIMFLSSIFYIVITSILYTCINDKKCIFNIENNRKLMNSLIYVIWGLSIIFFISTLYQLYKGNSTLLIFGEKWTRSFSFFFQFITLILSILIASYFSENKCDGTNGTNNSMAIIMIQILCSASAILTTGTFWAHIHIDCNCNH